ncbi:MAG: radical SAM protein [Oscillospiraceae bacterium]|nr:radical SAM protein [Oscillospiraceae bacterium]
MDATFDVVQHLNNGVRGFLKGLLNLSDFSAREAVFLAKFYKSAKAAADKRRQAKETGLNVPAFLIASITSQCNLHCAGCYARSLDSVTDEKPVEQLSGEEWGRIFREASELGVSFILLAGGEPLVRRDVLLQAAEQKDILFPVFTNGTLFSERTVALFDENRNLAPVLSIEGDNLLTDNRRGDGVYQKLMEGMERLREKKILFGASITVTNENLAEVTSPEYIGQLQDMGCKVVIFVEFVPTNQELTHLALSESEQDTLRANIMALRDQIEKMEFIAFPGDEKNTGGCIAAGRGFFHINSHGGAEPCPFSPYSDVNIRDSSLLDAMQSPLFTALRSGDILMDDHTGGCVLYEKRAQVEAILNAGK